MVDGRYAVTVSAQTVFVPEESDAGADRYVFAYTITLVNTGAVAAQLLSRHWIITDANNRRIEVRGEGVVGEQPVLKPGETYRYTSGAAIETPVGTMRGAYQMRAEDGAVFEAEIPEFTLSIPRVLH